VHTTPTPAARPQIEFTRAWQILLGGLLLGILFRWMSVAAPPLPVYAEQIESAAATNSPAQSTADGWVQPPTH
jgi:hypothetical protein